MGTHLLKSKTHKPTHPIIMPSSHSSFTTVSSASTVSDFAMQKTCCPETATCAACPVEMMQPAACNPCGVQNVHEAGDAEWEKAMLACDTGCDQGPPCGDTCNYEQKEVACTKMVPFEIEVPCFKTIQVDQECERMVPKKVMKPVTVCKQVLMKREVPCKKTEMQDKEVDCFKWEKVPAKKTVKVPVEVDATKTVYKYETVKDTKQVECTEMVKEKHTIKVSKQVPDKKLTTVMKAVPCKKMIWVKKAPVCQPCKPVCKPVYNPCRGCNQKGCGKY